MKKNKESKKLKFVKIKVSKLDRNNLIKIFGGGESDEEGTNPICETSYQAC
ncbi:hypothetical protein [Aquimarina sp. AD10]|uniref:hypothetical protein n=1 Tax=Aquimarina sp. AD10 TaxID=1714849 RepID=UPI0013149186|nr:hypothetical protein [Aquimarina sp. AD10]